MEHCRSDLIDRARAGDRAAYAELFRAHQASLVRYFRTRRMDAPEDLASQVWVDVVRSLDRFDGSDDDFRGWLFTIAHRRGVDAVRRAARDGACSPAPVEHSPGADVAHLERTALDRAVELVSSLPDTMAEAVMLRVVNELPARDVARILGVSEGNVRVLVHRGLTRLRRRLAVTDAGAPAMKMVS